jgi:hypothetical protein
MVPDRMHVGRVLAFVFHFLIAGSAALGVAGRTREHQNSRLFLSAEQELRITLVEPPTEAHGCTKR